MKKRIRRIVFLIIVAIILTLLIVRFPYEKNYKVNDFIIKEIYKNNRYYYEINGKYNFDIYSSKRLKKIKNIEIIEEESLYCIIPKIYKVETYPLCYQNDVFTDFNIINSEKLDKYKNEITLQSEKNFDYYNNLDSNTIIALYNYKGFYVMKDDSVKEINLFESDRYDNSLAVLIKDKILIPNYDQKHEFNEFILFDLKSYKKTTIESKYDIDYDSYIAGTNNNKVYLFDNKYEKLYRINIKTKEVELLTKYVKIENNKEVPSSKIEYKNGISFYKSNHSNYLYNIKDNSVFRSIKENNKVTQKIIDHDIKIFNENKNMFYYAYNEDFYYYIPSKGTNKIFHYFELNFLDSEDYIFIYNK